MTYEEFRSDLLRKLEEKTNDLGYKEVKYYPDGFTSEDPADLSTIRNTNVGVGYFKRGFRAFNGGNRTSSNLPLFSQ